MGGKKIRVTGILGAGMGESGEVQRTLMTMYLLTHFMSAIQERKTLISPSLRRTCFPESSSFPVRTQAHPPVLARAANSPLCFLCYLSLLFVVAGDLHICTGVCYGVLRFLFRNVSLNNPDSPEVAETKREIIIWQRTAARLGTVSEEEVLVKTQLEKKILELQCLIETEGGDR